LLTKLKETVQSWIEAEARMAQRAGLTPNQVSALGVVFGVASGLAYWLTGLSLGDLSAYRMYLLLAVLLLLASGFCDALDGTLARLYGKTGLCDQFWGLLALIGSLLTSYARAKSEAAEVPMETVGIVERAERLLIVSAASLLSLVWTEALGLSVILLALATNFTVLQRAIYFVRKARSKSNG